MLLPIQTGSENPILRKKSTAVKQFDKKLKKFAKDMVETMLKKDGVGLAAPQVGVNTRMITINFEIGEGKFRAFALFNPKILDASVECVEGEEGCLSIPGEYGKVNRFREITLEFQDENGEKRVLQLDNFNARLAQHEIDHLDGILFIDKVIGKTRKEKPQK